ncbi:MAG TPA: hypothetical protein VN181_16040 [Thermoanaerobaculia bacterium]|nr:hypothetical protein [Thermoanaerobaculia bacterium]
MTAKKREKLGNTAGAFTRQAIFRTDDAIEVDDLEWVEIRRTRVFFDDVLLVTYHKEIGILFPVAMGVIAGFWGLIALAIATSSVEVSLIFFGLAALFAIPMILRLLLKLDVITVYGRRSKARLQFGYRKGRARRLYDEICEQVRIAQAPLTTPAPPPEQ